MSLTIDENNIHSLDDLVEGATIYHLAVENRDTVTLLSATEDNLMKVDRDNETTLHYAAVNDDLVQILPKIDTHVDLIYGEYDTTVLPQNGTIANKIIPDSDLTILPKENHFCLNSSKEKIIEIIKR